MASRSRDPRSTLAAFGAPLARTPRVDMPLEEAIVRALRSVRRDPVVLLSLPVVLAKQAPRLKRRTLLRRARELGLEAELGMFLELTGVIAKSPMLEALSKQLTPRESGAAPRYYPAPRGGKYGRALADQRTPPVVSRWGFRMNATEEDLRAFVRKHLA